MRMFHQIVLFFYIYCLFKPLRLFFLKRFPELKDIVLRHSILESQSFNAFFSDIDTTCIFKDGSETAEVIRAFERIRKILIMFDRPEYNTESEIAALEKVKGSEEWKLVEICWNLRKINWCRHSALARKGFVHQYKMERAIRRARAKILLHDRGQKSIQIQDLKYLSVLIPKTSAPVSLCYFSTFTENVKGQELLLEMSAEEFNFFHYLMPHDYVPSPWCENEKLMKHKKALTYHELFLSRSALRVKQALGEPTKEHEIWCAHLEKIMKSIIVILFRPDNAEKAVY